MRLFLMLLLYGNDLYENVIFKNDKAIMKKELIMLRQLGKFMIFVLIIGMITGIAYAKSEIPFKGSTQAVEVYTFQPTQPTLMYVDAIGSGNATHLGHYTVTYQFVVDTTNGSGIGSAHFIAANGDSLFTEITGQGSPGPENNVASIVETQTITGGTGRFANATGSFTVNRLVNLVTGVTAGSFDGTIVIH